MNPFLTNREFELQVAEVHHFNTMMFKGNTTKMTWENLVEVQKKVSVYKTGNNGQYTSFIFSMNRYARDIYLFIQANIGEDQDTIKLDIEKVMDACGMGRDSYYKGIDDLKAHTVILICKTNIFWINPFILFRGDRLAYYQQQCPECINKVVVVNSEKQDKST